jgi:hypothetical protein
LLISSALQYQTLTVYADETNSKTTSDKKDDKKKDSKKKAAKKTTDKKLPKKKSEKQDQWVFSNIQKEITRVIKIIQKVPVLDALAKNAIREIPMVGGLLVDLYQNSKDKPEDKTKQILQLLQEYQKMDEKTLKRVFNELQSNKEEILKNRTYLKEIVSDTKSIKFGLKSVDSKTDQIKNQLDRMEKKIQRLVIVIP